MPRRSVRPLLRAKCNSVRHAASLSTRASSSVAVATPSQPYARSCARACSRYFMLPPPRKAQEVAISIRQIAKHIAQKSRRYPERAIVIADVRYISERGCRSIVRFALHFCCICARADGVCAGAQKTVHSSACRHVPCPAKPPAAAALPRQPPGCAAFVGGTRGMLMRCRLCAIIQHCAGTIVRQRLPPEKMREILSRAAAACRPAAASPCRRRPPQRAAPCSA